LNEDSLDLVSHISLVDELIALVKNEHLVFLKAQLLLVQKLQNSTWSSDNDMRVLLWVFQNFVMLLDWLPSEEALLSHPRHELGESVELLLDLICKLSGVCEDDGVAWLGSLIHLI